MEISLSLKERMQEEIASLKNCVHMLQTRLIVCVPIVIPTHVETVVLLQKTQTAQ